MLSVREECAAVNFMSVNTSVLLTLLISKLMLNMGVSSLREGNSFNVKCNILYVNTIFMKDININEIFVMFDVFIVNI